MEIKIPNDFLRLVYSPIYLCGAGRKRCYRHLLSDEGSYWQRNRQLGVHRGRRAAGRSWLLPL